MTLGRQLYKEGSGRALWAECSAEWGLNRSDLQGKSTPGRGNSQGELPAARWDQGKAWDNTAWNRWMEEKCSDEAKDARVSLLGRSQGQGLEGRLGRTRQTVLRTGVCSVGWEATRKFWAEDQWLFHGNSMHYLSNSFVNHFFKEQKGPFTAVGVTPAGVT